MRRRSSIGYSIRILLNTETCMQKRGKAVADPGPKGKAAKKLKLRRTQPLGQAEF